MEHFVWNNCDSTYCNFLNIKLRHGYFSANITKFSEQVSLKHLQEQIILLTSKSEHMLVRIVYKKTDVRYTKWQLVATSGTTNYNEWQRMTTSGTTSDNNWYNERQRVVQRMTMSGATNEHKWDNKIITQCKTAVYSAIYAATESVL